MITNRDAKEGPRKPAKRLLAAGTKINGVWRVRAYLRAIGTGRETFWETGEKRRAG